MKSKLALEQVELYIESDCAHVEAVKKLIEASLPDELSDWQVERLAPAINIAAQNLEHQIKMYLDFIRKTPIIDPR